MNVSAKDLATNKEKKITITASTKLSKEEKEKMVKQAEEFEEIDKKKKEEAELKNNADALIYTARKTKEDLKDKLSKEHVDKIDKASEELQKTLSENKIDQIKTKSEELQKVLQEVGAAVYQATAKQAGPQAETASQDSGSSSQRPREKVVDADYKVVDEDKK